MGASRKAASRNKKRLRNKTPGHEPNKALMPFTPMSRYLCSILSVLEVSGETPVINELQQL